MGNTFIICAYKWLFFSFFPTANTTFGGLIVCWFRVRTNFYWKERSETYLRVEEGKKKFVATGHKHERCVWEWKCLQNSSTEIKQKCMMLLCRTHVQNLQHAKQRSFGRVGWASDREERILCTNAALLLDTSETWKTRFILTAFSYSIASYTTTTATLYTNRDFSHRKSASFSFFFAVFI